MQRVILVVVALVLFAGPAHARFDFGLRRDLPAGQNPAAVAVGDFNRDGNVDFAVAERAVDSLSVWFGDGTGKFGGRTRYPTGDYPTAMAAADINEDGRLDLVIVNGVSNTVTVYRGMPQGAFGARIDYAVGQTPLSVAIGDVTGDTRLDIAVANSVSNTVTILVGGILGTGVNGTAVTVPTGSGPNTVVIGDLNGDGVNDLVTASTAADSVCVLRGDPAGGPFVRTDLPTFDQPLGLALGDLNKDGKLDLVVTTFGTPLANVFLNVNGDLVQGTSQAVGNNAVAVRIGDFDMDSASDIAVAHSTSALITFMGGGGTGLFSPAFDRPAGGSGVLALEFADFDGDGNTDILAPCVNASAVSVMLGYGLGPFGLNIQPAGAQPQGVAVLDMNDDGHPDFAIANGGSPSLTTYINNGNGSFGGTRVDIPAPPGPNNLVAANFNGDARVDLALTTYRPSSLDTNRVTVFLNQGNRAFSRADYDVTVDFPHVGLAVGDVTHDGKLDLLTGHLNTSTVQVLAGNGLGAFSIGTPITTYNSPSVIDLADVDANGWLDVFVGGFASFDEGRVCEFLADGLGGFAPRVDHLLTARPAAIVHGDFDEDGKLDIAGVSQGTGSITLFKGNGLGGFTNVATVLIPGSQLYSLMAGDFNADGDLDLLAGRATTSLALLYGRGDGSFGQPNLISSAAGQAAIALAQFDGNASLDFVAAADAGSAVVGLSRVKTRTTLTVTPNPSPIGGNLTWQATVTKAQPDSLNPAGDVWFFDGVSRVGQATLINGVATFVAPGDWPWDRELSARYTGDLTFLASYARPLSHFTYVPTLDAPLFTTPTLALAPIGSPGRSVRLRYEVAPDAPARVTLHDVRGRILSSRSVTGAGTVELATDQRLAPGIYLLKLEQAGNVVTTRAVVL